MVFGKNLILLWQKCDAIGQVCIVADGQIFLNTLAIWSHWLECKTEERKGHYIVNLPTAKYWENVVFETIHSFI